MYLVVEAGVLALVHGARVESGLLVINLKDALALRNLKTQTICD